MYSSWEETRQRAFLQEGILIRVVVVVACWKKINFVLFVGSILQRFLVNCTELLFNFVALTAAGLRSPFRDSDLLPLLVSLEREPNL